MPIIFFGVAGTNNIFRGYLEESVPRVVLEVFLILLRKLCLFLVLG